MAPRVFFDTCALYGIDLADTCLRLAGAGSFEPKWSADVLEELRRNLVRSTGLSETHVAKRIGMMETAFHDARVTGYQYLEDSLTCDEKDRHVLAAAIHCGATDLVTFNLKDFPLTRPAATGSESSGQMSSWDTSSPLTPKLCSRSSATRRSRSAVRR